MGSFDTMLETLGFVALLYSLFYMGKACLAVYSFFMRGGKRLIAYGEWAVVTGATDGIGKAYAYELARQGLNVLIISRTESKLVELAKEIQEKYRNVRVSHLSIDLSNFDQNARELVKAKIAGLDVGVLINNVGMSYPFTKYFHQLKDDEVHGLIELNVNSTIWMTRLVLGTEETDGMIRRRRGAIVNTSSGAGRNTAPLLAEYSAVKSFIELFSRGLKAELASFNIDVQAQAPLFVATKLAKIRKTSLTVPGPSAYVREAAKHIGYEDSVSPYWAHALQLWALRQLPEWAIIKLNLMIHLPIRKAGMKKEALRADGSAHSDNLSQQRGLKRQGDSQPDEGASKAIRRSEVAASSHAHMHTD